MTKLEVFANRIELISGVESFVLVRRSGEVVTHNMKDPNDLASMVTICGIGSNAVMQTIGFSNLRHLSINRIDQRNFLVFHLDRYFLGVQQVAGTDDQKLAAEIYDFLQNLLQQHRKEAHN
jgi:hypothetical protein